MRSALTEMSINTQVCLQGSCMTGTVTGCSSEPDKQDLEMLFSCVRQLTDVGKGQEYPLEPGVMIEFQRDQPKIVGEIFDPASGRQ